MNKRLLAVAVAGAFALPGAALAQSSVTISGFAKGGFESLSMGNSARANNSQTGVVDDSSRVIFNMREDLGGGLAAIAQVDMRWSLDQGALSAAGNNHVGLQSKNWGRLFVGRQDVHYFGRESDLTVRGSLRADSISILAYAGNAVPGGAAGGVAIANASRTPNIVHYTTPNWGGFSAVLAYSSQPITAGAGAAGEADIGSGVRKGRAWNFAPNFAAKNWNIGWSHWNSKPDAFGALDQRADRLFGSYKWGGFKLGLAWDRSKLKAGATGVETSNRTAWSIPAHYEWGNHGIYGHYSVARDDKAAVYAGLQTGAKMIALSYAYNFSRRTSAAFTYARIRNDTSAAYSLFTMTGLGIGAGTLAGEDPRLWAVTLRHAF
jgi:predicted porin